MKKYFKDFDQKRITATVQHTPSAFSSQAGYAHKKRPK